jgi:hypothetical protein
MYMYYVHVVCSLYMHINPAANTSRPPPIHPACTPSEQKKKKKSHAHLKILMHTTGMTTRSTP